LVIDDILEEDFRNRILPLDSAAAAAFVEITAHRRQQGRPMSQPAARRKLSLRPRGAVSLSVNQQAELDDSGVSLRVG